MGHFAVQLAKVHWKAHVVTTAGPKNVDFIKQARPPSAIQCTTIGRAVPAALHRSGAYVMRVCAEHDLPSRNIRHSTAKGHPCACCMHTKDSGVPCAQQVQGACLDSIPAGVFIGVEQI